MVDSHSFVKTFLQLGVTERHKHHTRNIESAKILEIERKAIILKNNQMSLFCSDIVLDKDYTGEDKKRAMELLNTAAEVST